MAKTTSNAKTRKIVRSERSLAIDALWESEAKAVNKTVAALKAFAVLNIAARRSNTKIAEYVATFDAAHPKKTRSEFASKLAEMDAAIVASADNAVVLKVLTAQRSEMIKRHDASVTNAAKAAKSRKDRKASPVTSFDEFGMPLVA